MKLPRNFQARERRTRWTDTRLWRGSRQVERRRKLRVRKAEWTDRPTLHGNCERHRHGVVGCARIVKETPNGAENTDFSASSFLSFFFFSPSSFLPRDISSNSVPTGLSKLCRVAYWTHQDCVPLAPFFLPSRGKVETLGEMDGEGEKGGERIGGFYYLNISTNIHASASSRENALATDVNVTASFHEQNRFSRKWGSLERNYIHYILERNRSPNSIPLLFRKTKLCKNWKSVRYRYDRNLCERKKKKQGQMKRERRSYYELEAKTVSWEWWWCGREMRTVSLLRFEIRMHSGWLLSPASDMYAGDVNTGFGILRQ